MEEELTCPVCQSFFKQPVVLPCHHIVCFKCADTLIVKQFGDSDDGFSGESGLENTSGSEFGSDQLSIDSSVTSESDSGYSGNSDGGIGSNRSVSTLEKKFFSLPRKKTKPVNEKKENCLEVSLPILPKSINCLICPVCQKTMFLDDRGTSGLARHKIAENIIQKYRGTLKRQTFRGEKPRDQNGNYEKELRCQSCHQNFACLKCTQCDTAYSCKGATHEDTGPFSDHVFLLLESNRIVSNKLAIFEENRLSPAIDNSQAKINYRLLPCVDHPTENTSLYCSSCCIPLCVLCQLERKHVTHDVKAIGALFKEQKYELSKHMNSLSTKAKKQQEIMAILKNFEEDLEKQANVLKAKMTAEYRRIIEAVEMKEKEMKKEIDKEKNFKAKELRGQLQQCSLKLQKATGLLEYCVEVINEDDASAYLQISENLCQRVSNMAENWNSVKLGNQKRPSIELTCDFAPLVLATENLQLCKVERIPPKPFLYVESKELLNERGTLFWTLPSPTLPSYKYKLEIDNGCNGAFREIYVGTQNSCTVQGLHPNSLYKARVWAFNKAGYGPPSNVLQLKTIETSYLRFNVEQNRRLMLSNEGRSITVTGTADRVILADRGFSTGTHYWELSIDRFDSGSTPAFGIALFNVDRNKVLGKNALGWSIQSDNKKNWLQHNSNIAKRNSKGLKIGSKVGVLLNLGENFVDFYINGEHQGSLTLHKNSSTITTYYPAVAIDHRVTVTLRSFSNLPSFLISSDANSNNSIRLKRSMSLNYKNKRPPPPRPPSRNYDSSTFGRVNDKSPKTT